MPLAPGLILTPMRRMPLPGYSDRSWRVSCRWPLYRWATQCRNADQPGGPSQSTSRPTGKGCLRVGDLVTFGNTAH